MTNKLLASMAFFFGYGYAIAQTPNPIQQLTRKFPVSAEVVEFQRQVEESAGSNARKLQLGVSHRQWLITRGSQCLAQAAVRTQTQSTELQRCLSGADQDRVQSLRRTKLMLLLEAPPQPISPLLANVRISAPLNTGGGGGTAAATPNGGRVVAIGLRRLLIVDTLSGNTLRNSPLPHLENSAVSTFPSGRVALVTDRFVRGMSFWDIESGERLREFMGAMGPHQIMPDGRHVAYGDADKLLIYDPVADRAVSGPSSHGGESIFRIAASKDGKRLATLTTTGLLTVWSPVSGPDGTFLLSRTASTATRIDNRFAQALEFSERGDSVWTANSSGLTADSTLTRWPVPPETQNATNQQSAPITFTNTEFIRIGTTQARQMRKLPGSDTLVVPGFQQERGSYLIFYDTQKKTTAFVQVDRNYYPTLAFSADGRFLFTTRAIEVRRQDIPTARDYLGAELALAPLLPVTPSLQVKGPILKGLPADLQIEAIGVYEGGGQQVQSVQTSSGIRSARSVTVGVGATSKPLALVLTSYEPVIWDLNLAKNSNLTHVFLSGYYESLIRGAENVQVVRIGGAYTYTFGDPLFVKLQEQIRLYTGKSTEGFQGAYKGIRFSVGSGAPQEVASVRRLQGSGADTPIVGGNPRQSDLLMGRDLGIAPQLPSDTEPKTETQVISHMRCVPGSRAFGPGAAQVNAACDLANAQGFPEKLYEVSAYTSEDSAIDTLIGAEIELVVSRWLAQKLAAVGGQLPRGAPAGWENMTGQLRKALEPIAEQHKRRRPAALSASGLSGKTPFLLEYERLIFEPKSRPNIQFSDGSGTNSSGNQLGDIPEILAFHQTQAAIKWRKLWPELRAHAANLAAVHYRVDADPALGGSGIGWNERANRLLQRIGGRILTPHEWLIFSQGRLGFTLSGLDRFVLPLGTAMSGIGITGGALKIEDKGSSVVITQREGRGLVFRLLDAKWEREISKIMSDAELKQIDDALTASYVERKGRWFAALELEWDAYMSISLQMRTATALQQVYQSFAAQSAAIMASVWAAWLKE